MCNYIICVLILFIGLSKINLLMNCTKVNAVILAKILVLKPDGANLVMKQEEAYWNLE